MKEVIEKLKSLTETEERGQSHAENHFIGLKIELDSVRAAVISSAAASDAQRLSLAMRAEKLAKAEARRRALAEKEARQEADEMRKAQLAGGGATGIDLSSFKPEGEKKGIVGTIVAAIVGVITTVIGFIETVKASPVFKLLKKRLANLFKPGGALGKIGDLFRKGGRFSKIGEIFTKVSNFFKGFGGKLAPLFKKGSALSKIAPLFGKIGDFFKGFGSKVGGIFKKGGALTKVGPLFKKIGDFFKGFGSKVGSMFKSGGALSKAGGIFKKVFGVIGKLGGVLGRVFAPLGVILGAFAGIFDAVKAVQGEEGDLGDKVIAGITGFFQGFIGFAIGGLLDLGKDLLAWLLGVFGVPEEKLEGMKNFSVTDFLKDLIGNIFDGVEAFISSMFDGMFEGFYLTEGNIFQKILGGIMGLITGWADGLLEGYSKIIDGIASFFGNDDFSFKDWITGLVTDIFNGIKDFFKGVIDKGMELMMSAMGGLTNIGDTIKSFVRDMLPDPDAGGFFGLVGKFLSKTGIYDFVNSADAPPAEADPQTFVDTSAIIPSPLPVGEALTQAGNMTNSSSVTVVNNNGGNVTNTTTSNQSNRTTTASPPVLSGSALAM